MCDRFSFVTSKKEIENHFDIEITNTLRISYNIAPTHHAYVVTNKNPKKIQYLTWGLIPQSSKDGTNKGKLIKARKEGIGGSPSFRMPIRSRRCLILADSFYEWKQEGMERKPYRIHMKDQALMIMAGVWDVWYKGDYAIKSFSIITTPSNEDMSGVSSRMPLIFDTKEKQEKWLSDIPLTDVLDMLTTLDNGLLHIYRVSEIINSIKHNSMDLHTAI